MSRLPIQAYAGDEYDGARASRNKKKAPALGGATGAKSDPNNQEQEQTMSTLPRIPAHFDTAINVAGLTVAPNELIGGGEPDESVVTLVTHEETISFTPAEACALAAALQAVAVHLLESEPRTVTRKTEPGSPSFEERV